MLTCACTVEVCVVGTCCTFCGCKRACNASARFLEVLHASLCCCTSTLVVDVLSQVCHKPDFGSKRFLSSPLSKQTTAGRFPGQNDAGGSLKSDATAARCLSLSKCCQTFFCIITIDVANRGPYSLAKVYSEH